MKRTTSKLWGWEHPALGIPAEAGRQLTGEMPPEEPGYGTGKEKESEPETGEKADYYKATIKTDKKVFADEVVKYDMLSLLWKQTIRWNYEVIAFTLLDDQLHLILATRGREASTEGDPGNEYEETNPDREILEDLKRGCRTLYGRSAGKACRMLRETSSWEKLERPDVLRECCDIHQIPVRTGYVDKASKYWWTSYISYRGKYYWKFLNCRELLSSFSPDPARASAMFCKEQTSFGKRQAASKQKENS